ncbi:LexA family protein [Brevundimonas sp.]|uniref:LexA family protein n=1 Tax=Brevundimonas sp. TaxID=1871086 RepID=UPI003F71B71C
MSKSLTHQQARTLSFIRRYLAENPGVAPSFQEIADELDLASKSAVHRLLDALQERGHIRRDRAQARSIELVSAATSFDLTALSDAELKTLAGRVYFELQGRAA